MADWTETTALVSIIEFSFFAWLENYTLHGHINGARHYFFILGILLIVFACLIQ